MSADKKNLENSLPLIVAGLIMCLISLAGSVWFVSGAASAFLDGIVTQALEVNFAPGMSLLAFGVITFIGLTVTAVLQLFKIEHSVHVQTFVFYCAVLGILGGFSARIVSPYAVGYYLESIGYSFCEYRTIRGFREITELSWVRYESMCEDDIDLTGLTEAKLQEHLRTEEGALEKAEALGIFLK